MQVRDAVAIVAGGSGGIGAATVRALVARGARVVVAAPADAVLDAVAREMASHGDQVLIVPTDITRRDDIDALVAKTLATFGRIDILANVAGIGSSPSLCDCSAREIERVLAVNLLGAAWLMHAVLPSMKAQGGGSIVNIGSVAGEAAVMGIYSASKFGLRGLNDSVRREVRSLNIGVTLIEPGFVQTPINPGMENLPGPEIVASAIVAAVARPRRRRIVPAAYWFAVTLINALPDFVDLVFGDARVQERLNHAARTQRAVGSGNS
jgi:NAD(P)-dependent dehydrogenase (short-subunit alcohol dehydrogenase family)